MDVQDIKHYLNRYLPMDIAITDVEEVDDRFHAQLNARYKTYVYRMTISDVPSTYSTVRQLTTAIRFRTRTHAAGCLHSIGKHDFKNFSTVKKTKSTVREVTNIEIYDDIEEMQITLRADDFLHNMARIIIGTLLDVGFGTRSLDDIDAIFDGTADASAPCDPKGLYLQDIEYAAPVGNAPTMGEI